MLARQVELSSYIAPLPLPVRADRIQLQQVILNLLLNAFDAVKAVDDRPRQIWVQTASDAEGVRLSVRDTGVGISPESLAKLFEPFFTTKADGMGIGLSVNNALAVLEAVFAEIDRILGDDEFMPQGEPDDPPSQPDPRHFFDS